MQTLIIYDNSGDIFSQISGEYNVPNGGVQFLETEAPEGKRIVGVDISVTPHQAILEDIPKTEVELLKEQLIATQQAVDFLLLGGI